MAKKWTLDTYFNPAAGPVRQAASTRGAALVSYALSMACDCGCDSRRRECGGGGGGLRVS